MTNEDEIMSAAEFFGELDNVEKISSCACRTRGKKSEKALFSNIKVKMVMRAHGISRPRALEIIAKREDGKDASKDGMVHDGGMRRRADETFMSAEEFFA